jgi:hypothetical protein
MLKQHDLGLSPLSVLPITIDVLIARKITENTYFTRHSYCSQLPRILQPIISIRNCTTHSVITDILSTNVL